MPKPSKCKRMLRAACVLAAAIFGCRAAVNFPAKPVPSSGKAFRAYDVHGDGSADFFLLANAAGRVDAIGYGRGGKGQPDTVVQLDAIPLSQCRHLVIILDGFDYEMVRAYYDAGGLRVCYPPGRVVAPYPGMTDLAMEDLLGYMPCRGFEALYYDRHARRLSGGSAAYLAGKNAPYNHLLNYRANLVWDALAYMAPWQVFGKEVNDAKRLFDRARTQEVLTYFVSSAAVGTRQGADGQRKCLQRIEQFVLQVLHETHGLVKFTFLADHGHSHTPSTRLDIEGYLKHKGWRLAERLERPKDVVCIPFGLVTYASFATDQAEALAADLAELEGVELASFAQRDTAVVLGPGKARAVIQRKGDAYRYDAAAGDPLKLRPILAKLAPDTEGYHRADVLLGATADHVYPAPLQRIWRAHFALAENPPDVIVSLANRFYYGSGTFAGAVRIASTHGSLERRNSVTFLMSSIGQPAGLMQSKDVPEQMRKLTGWRWPSGR